MAECWSPISICGAQFNRNDCDGNILNGTSDVILTCGVVEIERSELTGDERTSTDPNGQGGFCAKRVINPTVEGYEYQITWCSRIDPELLEILGLYDRVTDDGTPTGNTIGFKPRAADASCLCEPGSCLVPGVTVHFWKLAWDGEDPNVNFDFEVEAVPRLIPAPGTTFTFNDEFNQVVITGRSKTNPNYGQGPGNIYPEPAGLDREFAQFLTNTGFPGGCNCNACGYAPGGTAIGN